MEKQSLKDFMKQGTSETVIPKPVEPKAIAKPELITDVDINSDDLKVKAKSSGAGIIPELSDVDKAEIKTSLMSIAETHSSLIEVYAKILRNDGYTDEEIVAMPIVKLQHLGRIISDNRRDMMKELEAKGFNRDEIKSLSTVQLEKLLNGKTKEAEPVEETSSGAIESVTKLEENEEVKEVATEKEVNDEIVEDEITLKDALSKNKDVAIKYIDKPVNSYRRSLMNKTRKLIERQKRGKSVDIFLPNSNIKLRMYELHQTNIVQELISMEISKSISVKRKSMQLLLERSSVIASNGDEITVDGLLNSISISDIPYIQVGAAVVNSVDTIPYVVRCEKCGRPNVVSLNANKVITDALNSIPSEVISEFRESDTFEDQISKATTKLTAQVEDKKAYCVVEISNVSIADHILIGETGKQYVVDAFQDSLPKNTEGLSLDNKYDILLQKADPDIIRTIAGLLIAQYVKAIKYYKFDTVEGTEWYDDVNFDFEFTLDDPIDVILDGILGLEDSTLNIMQQLIQEKFIKAALEIHTGLWKCVNCSHKQDSPVVGLELLMSSLQNKTLSDI